MLHRYRDKLKSVHKVTAVTDAYKSVVKDTYGKYVGGRAPVHSATDFYDLSVELDADMYEMMEEAIHQYAGEWCERTFGKPYPPMNIVLGPKSQAKLRLSRKKKPLKSSNYKHQAKQYVDLLSDVKVGVAVECVKEGWPDGPQELRDEIIVQLKAKNNN